MLLLAATVLLGASTVMGDASAGLTPIQIANFALNLECLEASFYSWAAFGKGLSAEDFGGEPDVIGGMKAKLSPVAQAYAEEIAKDEIAHVRALRAALGDDAVTCPHMDIGPAFVAAANAAANANLHPEFDPYANDLFFYHGAFIFEDVGVTAYMGAIPALQNSPLVVTAAQLGAIEAYHAGIIRHILFQAAYPKTCYGNNHAAYKYSVEYSRKEGKKDKMSLKFDITKGTKTPYGVTVAQLLDLISDLRDNADGNPANQDEGIIKDGEVNLVPADENALPYIRSAEEILAIVYLTGDASKVGGFYPKGINLPKA